jgi:hypothetical protein
MEVYLIEINLLIKGMKTDIILFVRKYHNLFIKTPCLMRPFSEFPSMVAIDRFDCNDENETVLYRQLFVYTYALSTCNK